MNFCDGFQGTLDEGCVMMLWDDLYDFKLHCFEGIWKMLDLLLLKCMILRTWIYAHNVFDKMAKYGILSNWCFKVMYGIQMVF